jgi:hypothetical protein
MVNPNARANFDLFSAKVSFDDISNVTATEALWLEHTILSLAAVNHPGGRGGHRVWQTRKGPLGNWNF